MEMLPEVEPELEEAELQEEEAEQEEEEGGEDGGLSELRELEETLAKVQIAPSAAQLLDPKAEADSSKLPVSYRENSAKEKLLQTMADNFNCQYSYLYPDRTPLLLCPLNECGVQKFVSTTLRPTLLPYPEIYHWQGCASFISDFLSLQPLDPPVDLPKKLCSPTWTLRTQKGTCFEFSTLLCSLLLGAGYNAYCVSGYAMKEMCLLNQNRQECPLLKPQVKKAVVQQKEEKTKYTVKPPHDLYSRFEKRQEQKRQEEARVALLSQQQEAQRLQEERERPPPDPLLGLRVHCWVLVLSGNREVPENFFIDPLAGQSYPTTSEKFLGIESIWNHQNYWVNMQDCRFGCTEMTFDLGNPVKWEYLLRGSTSHNILLNSDTKTQNDQEDEEEEDEETEEVFEMPPSWVSRIHISQEDMESRYPGGTKLIQYRQATVEKFAPYLMKDGLITRLTTYNDLDCTHPNTVTEWYKHRHDHLDERELEKATGLTTEHFRPGRSYALKCHRYVTLIPETERQMDFYSRFRVDDLASRVETPSEMTETFENRPDFLYHRQVVYDKQVLSFEPAENAKQVRRPIKKVVEKFHRDHSKAASEDVAKRVFLLSEDQIQVTYHLEEDRSIPAWRNFIKPRDWQNTFTPQLASSFQVDPRDEPDKELFLYEALMALMAEEKNVLTGIQDSEEEVRAILDARQQEESGITLQISIYDTARNEKARMYIEELKRLAEEELLNKEEKELDILAPFLAKLGNPASLTREQVQQLVADCLAEMKQRLVDRANLIQARFEKETQELQQKQQWYQKNQLTMTQEDEDAYLAYCSDAMFRIHVVKLRLNRHKDKAPQMYLALRDKLRRDPRLIQHLW
ncbi:dynein regulatory complex subunit 7 [Astyanax mexicanus]|uniref:Dynein regulatory complex subunit 7 n=1 Tax=Astyanax mexicanus TaxID=7994 RepID=A0A8T2LIV8_ASTMX|nr:dynein regulatory complex subunit 7 [Astyanax mexicanus]